MEWSIRSLLNPVITRLLIYGVNPIDVEYVVSKVESMNHLSARSLEMAWASEWEKKANCYEKLAETALSRDYRCTAGELFMQAAQCYYAVFLINQALIEDKKRFYGKYSELYRISLSAHNSRITPVDIPLDKDSKLTGHLYHPSHLITNQKTCAVILSGLGSCKEEMHTLADPLLDRGISVYIPDMPGNGESLFSRNITCNIQNLEKSFTAITDTLKNLNELAGYTFGVYGLCMGGGYAFRAACVNSQFKFCITLFPLLISKVEKGSTPQWMKQSEWAKFQMGNIPPERFIDELSLLEQGSISCPYFFIHGRYDNWMTLDSAFQFISRASGPVEKLIIESEPVYSNKQIVTHTMPVGEQLHWLRHIVADWVLTQGSTARVI